MKQPPIGEINFFGKNYKLISPSIKNFAMQNERAVLIDKLNESITSFRGLIRDVDSVWKKDIENLIKKKFYRRCIKAFFRRGLHQIKIAKRLVIKGKNSYDGKKILEYINTAALSVGSIQQLLIYSKILSEKETKDHLIPLKKIRKGDVIFSYKTNSFLKGHFLSRLICRCQYSPITHISLVSKKSGGVLKILTCRPETKGVKEIKFELMPGEIALVARPRIGREKKVGLFNKMKEFISLSKENPSAYKFSERKCWTGVFLAFIYSRTVMLSSKNIIVPNPIQKTKGYFCSELIDEIFYSIGIPLTIRSCYGATAGPSEIFYSPHLSYKGIFCAADKLDIGEELDF